MNPSPEARELMKQHEDHRDAVRRWSSEWVDAVRRHAYETAREEILAAQRARRLILIRQIIVAIGWMFVGMSSLLLWWKFL
jgi:hypothetical protein